MANFISLHNHTYFSILNALPSPKEYFIRAKELGQTSIGITDKGTLAGVWDSFKASKEVGVKLIIGCQFFFTDNATNKEDKLRFVILIAKNAIGYKNILILNRIGFENASILSKKPIPIIDWKLLEKYSDGVICLTGCSNGIIGGLLNDKKFEEAEKALIKLKEIFGDNLGAEVQTHNLLRQSNYDTTDQVFTNNHIIRLAKKLNIRVVPTNNSHYIKKEDAETHDVELAVGSMQPVYSNARLKYNITDLYLKSTEEVKKFFSRNNDEEFVDKMCENTEYFASLCEEPVWIDPKHTNPSGKELPEFPVKDEKCYDEFKQWLKTQPENIQKMREDKAYLRFVCYNSFEINVKPNIKDENLKEYYNRMNEELEVLEYQGFSSYMLVVYDYVRWARENNVSVGPGRGCLTSDAKVLTTNGFKNLDKIKIGDTVFSHTGEKRSVLETFVFDVSNEELLKIKTDNSFEDITLTKDHKLFAAKNILTERYVRFKSENLKSLSKIKKYEDADNYKPEWIRAKDLAVGDLIYTTFPQRNIDISNLPKDFTIRYSTTKNGNLDKSIEIKFDNEFIYWLGRFAGDGWLHTATKSKRSYYISIAFNSNDTIGINSFCEYFAKYGIKLNPLKHKTKDLVQIYFYNKDLALKFKEFFNDYKGSSGTKHLPYFFRSLPDDMLKSLINGLIDSDGSKKDIYYNKYDTKLSGRWSIDSTSKRMILEVKEALLFLKTKSSVQTRKAFMRGKFLCNKSYKLRFKEIDFKNNSGEGYYSKIKNVSLVKENYVYDITVDQDHSYLTSNYVVHNSVAGCFVAYLLDIHKADPIKYGLVFARFQNKEKTSFPDIDQDFATSGRGKIIEYIINKYGTDKVASISNFNKITPKVYARDIARSCELAGTRQDSTLLGNAVADSISAEQKDILSFDELVKKSPLFAEYTKKYPKYAQYKSLLGLCRNFSTHAAAIVISARPLPGLVPLRKDKDGSVCIEYEKNNTEENGMVKMDILGLSTLDIIDEVLNLIKKHGKEMPVNHFNYDYYDKKTYDLISSGDTYGVFQFGTSAGTIDLCKKIKPMNIEDLAIITTLARPAAKNIREDFIEARSGKKKFKLLHPSLKSAFEQTFGFGLFDESILKLGQDVAGWSLHSADRIRKMIKDKGKNPEKILKLRSEFIEDTMKVHNVDKNLAMKIWDEEVGKFQGYTFNKAHAVTYSFISYTTAYLKAHYPVEFLLANLMAEVRSGAKQAAENIEKIKLELRRNKIRIIPPDINKSSITYEITEDGSLLTGFDALKFAGDDAIQDIIAHRPFKSFDDFMVKTVNTKVSSKTVQALAASGCFDHWGIPRKLIYLYVSDYKKKLQVWLKKHDPLLETFEYPWPNEKNWTLPELYALEKSFIGESFVCGKTDAYKDFFKQKSTSFKEIRMMHDKEAIPAVRAEIKSIFEFAIKKETSKMLGQKMMKATIEDEFGDMISLTIFPKQLSALKSRMKDLCGSKYKFEEGLAIHFNGTVNVYEDEVGIVLENFYTFAPPPEPPKDLKAKKVVVKKKTSTETTKSNETETVEDFISDAEDELFDAGLIDLEEDLDD